MSSPLTRVPRRAPARAGGLVLAAVCVVALVAVPASAAPSAAQTAAQRARVGRAVARYETALARQERTEARVERTSAELDRIVAEEQETRTRLTARARSMYRSGDTSFVSVLLGATSFQEFATRWSILTRLSRQDAQDIGRLAEVRVEIERSAETLLRLQAEQARFVEATKLELTRARRELAASRAALAAYNERVADASRRNSSGNKSDSMQQLTGSGAWSKGLASHYSRTFTGRGANGERIGPYSMMVAHKTLPFGTLVEIEYRGKRAVAKVADRGPRSEARVFDLGPGVVRVLGFNGVHQVRYRIIKR